MACEKVLSLDIREPLMKILTGLEYVLRKAQVKVPLHSLLIRLGVCGLAYVHVHRIGTICNVCTIILYFEL